MERQIQETLVELLSREEDIDCMEIVAVGSFVDAGVESRNHGLVLRLSDGSEYQLTIVRSK